MQLQTARRAMEDETEVRYLRLMETPGWFLVRYPGDQAVRRADDFGLLEDFRFAVMTMSPSSYGGSVVNWMSRELIARGIRA